jgi:subtilase family serine protease
VIEYFRAVPKKIPDGGCTVLEWGAVSNATEAIIEPKIGGVATPGSQTVCPAETTTYYLTAVGLSGMTTALTTVTVGPPMPDLIVSSVVFEPSPPLQSQDTNVQIIIENVGTVGAGIFNWEWEAEGDASFGGRLMDLAPGESTTVTALWDPTRADASLLTTARADVDNEVVEADEDNNELVVNVEVIEPPFGDLVLQEFFLGVDGQVIVRVSNPGGRIIAPTFEYDLYLDGSLEKSGFGNTPPLGSMPTWTEHFPTGQPLIRVVIDPQNLIDEADEANNELTLICSADTLTCWSP